MYNKTTHFVGDSCSFSLPQYAKKSRFYPLSAFVVAIDMPANLLFFFPVFEIIELIRFCFSSNCHWNIRRFRVFCHWLVNHSTFGNVILLCIMCSSALLAVERPIETPEPVSTLFFSKTRLLFESFQGTHTFLFLDSEISGLLFRGHFYGGASAEVNHIWIYFTQRIILSIGI